MRPAVVMRARGARLSAAVQPSDVAIALAVATAQIGLALLATLHRGRPAPAALGLALLAAGPLALLARRRHPRGVLVATFAVALVYSALDYAPRGVVFVALVVAFWTAMLSGRRRLGWLSILLGYCVFVVVLPLLGAQPVPGLAWATGIAAWMLLLGAAAEIVRVRRERSRQTALASIEQSRRVAGEERLRIARELHDVLAHNISLISLQAGVGLHLLDERPEQARTALKAIKYASNDAMTELRSVLEILRQPGQAAPRSPVDGLDRLQQLISRTRQAGLPVSATVEGEPRALPPATTLAAYRIVQEALTNVTRHAPGAPTSVQITYGARELVLEVDNDAPPDARRNGTGTPGNGITGMRERAGALRGTLAAGPRPAGGFAVRATLPLNGRQ